MGKIDLIQLTNEELKGLQSIIPGILTQRVVKKARDEGKSFARLKDIPFSQGHIHRFNYVEPIATDYPMSAGMRRFAKIKTIPSLYKCGCGEKAYSCTNCGYVPGKPKIGNFDTRTPDDGRGNWGTQEVCIICDEVLGQKTFGQSD